MKFSDRTEAIADLIGGIILGMALMAWFIVPLFQWWYK